jgi:hypothetical protein
MGCAMLRNLSGVFNAVAVIGREAVDARRIVEMRFLAPHEQNAATVTGIGVCDSRFRELTGLPCQSQFVVRKTLCAGGL